MTDADVSGAVRVFGRAIQAVGAKAGLPVSSGSAADQRWRQARARHFLASDGGGSWVAVDAAGAPRADRDADDDGTAVVGMAQAIVREGYWVLAQLATVPEGQGRGIGGVLLRHALSYGDPHGPGTIQCSRDPRAMALYAAHGFALHPATGCAGLVRHPVPRCAQVTRLEPVQVGRRELDVVASVDRSVRDSTRAQDIVAMLEQPGGRLLLHGERGYAVALDDRVVTLGAADDESAALLLRTWLADTPPGRPVEVSFLTSAQQWAMAELVAAGVELRPSGPVMVRGMDAPPAPYVPSGAFG
jgi:GNAT superfamily N-acetyltransferase